jgi:outer membrane lipoprotein-sorting protein
MSRARRQQGIGQVQMFGIGAAVIVVILLGWLIASMVSNHKSTLDNPAVLNAVHNADCTYADSDLCKFFAGYKVQKNYSINAAAKVGDSITTITIQSNGNDKFHLKSENGDTYTYEFIGDGNAIYIRASDGVWWKSTDESLVKKMKANANRADLPEPGSDAAKSSGITYKKVGTEKCGNLTCSKYQVNDPQNGDDKSYVWIDTTDYQLRRTTNQTADVNYEAIYSYGNVTINPPSNTQSLPNGKTIQPGDSQPTNITK